MTSTQAREAFDLSKEPRNGPRALRQEPFRPVLPAGPAADRGRRAVRHGQHVPDRLQRNHLGHPRLEAVHLDRRHARTSWRRCTTRRYSALARGSEPARHARKDAGLQPGRVRPHAARSIRPAAATTGRNAGRRISPAAACKGGRVVGRSDAIGGVPAERPVDPAEVVATIFHSLGLNLETQDARSRRRPFPLVDYGKHEINELF